MESANIIELLKLEVDICRYYNELSEREVFKRYNSSFTSLVGMIKMAIERQNEILKTLNMGELLSATNDSYKEYVKKYNSQIDVDDVMSRVNILCTKQLVSNSIENEYAVLNRGELQAKYIVMGESISIHLSFIDEYLSKINDFGLRKMLCTFKYFFIYVMGVGIEDSLIERYYKTEPSIYLTSYLEANIKHIPVECIDGSKREFAHKILEGNQFLLCKIVLSTNPEDAAYNSFYGQDLLRASIILRSELLLLNEKDFIDMLNKLGVSKDNPWYKVFLSDRERHKIVTLGQSKIR